MPSSSSSVSSWDESKKKSGNLSDEKEYDTDGNELYVVEEIRDKRKHYDHKKKETVWMYHLKWKGYSEKEMTWEPVDNMDCPDLLNEFERKWKAKQKAKQEKERHSRDKHRESHSKDRHKERRKSFDSDYDTTRPSTSSLSKTDKKKRKHSSESEDSSDERKKKKSKSLLSYKKEKKKGSDSDSDDIKEVKKKKYKSDSDSDSEKKKTTVESDAHKKLFSKPGPKRAKEARLQKLKEAEEKSKSSPKSIDSDDDKKKKNKSIDSDDEKKKKSNDSDEDEVKKKVFSKPGPKRAKEARLQKLKEAEKEKTIEKPKEKPKTVDSDDDSNESKKKKSNDSDSDSEKASKVEKSNEEQKIMSRPGPKRAKEAALAKLNSTPKTKPIEKKVDSDKEDDDSNDKKSEEKKKSDSSDDESEEKRKKESKESDKESNIEKQKERILSKPGPKRAKEAQIARLSQSRIEDNNSNDSNEKIESNKHKRVYNKSSDEEVEQRVEPKETESKTNNSPKKAVNVEEQRKSILSRPGPKRAKEARLQKMNESLQNSVSDNKDNENDSNNKGLENKRTNSTDSLDAIISTPAPEEDSLQMEQQLESEITSPKRVLSNGFESGDPSPAPESESNDLSGLDRIGNYVSIETTKHISEITNALSLRNGGPLEMERPGYVEKEFEIKSFSANSNKTVEKIITAFYTKGDKLCFLVKWNGINNCDVVLADDCNKHYPQRVIEYYKSKLRFT